jgi:hypothetical protein
MKNNKLTYFAASIVGNVPLPTPLTRFGDVGTGPGKLLQIVFQTMVVAGSIYALINFIIAGYGFMSAGADPKKVEGAWTKMWQTILGLVLVGGAFTLAGVVGKLIFNDWGFLLTPTLPTL